MEHDDMWDWYANLVNNMPERKVSIFSTRWTENDLYDIYCKRSDDELIDIHETKRIFNIFGLEYNTEGI